MPKDVINRVAGIVSNKFIAYKLDAQRFKRSINRESKEDAELAKDEINTWLKTRGLELSQEKTKIVHLTEGFDFLGFNIRHYKDKNTKTGYKLLIKPSKEYLKQTRRDIREIFLNHKGEPVRKLIATINPVIRGKANYMNKKVARTK